MTAEIKHIVICQQIVSVRDGFEIAYHFDGHRFPSREEAIDHGFTFRGSDDFNVGVLTAGRLTWFGWMQEHLDDYDLAEIEEQIGLVPAWWVTK